MFKSVKRGFIVTFSILATLGWIIFMVGFTKDKRALSTINAWDTLEALKGMNETLGKASQMANYSEALAQSIIQGLKDEPALETFPYYAFAAGGALVAIAGLVLAILPHIELIGGVFVAFVFCLLFFAGAVGYPAAMAVEKCATHTNMTSDILVFNKTDPTGQIKKAEQFLGAFSNCFLGEKGTYYMAQLAGSVIWAFCQIVVIIFYQWNSGSEFL